MQEAIFAVAAKLAEAPRELRAVAPVIRDLTPIERNQVIDTIIMLLDGLYAHLPQKRAMYGHDPVQRLRVLQQRVDDIDESDFHRSVAEILTDLRDAHTRYLGPRTGAGQIAVLPLLVETYDDANGDPHFIATKIFDGDPEHGAAIAEAGFDSDCEITHWNAVPIARAVELYAERETGGRPDARRARALESLTIRPLRYALPPDEEWVIISFVRKDRSRGEVRLEWRYPSIEDVPVSADLDGSARRVYAGNPAAESARRAKKLLFAPEQWFASDRDRLISLQDSCAQHKEEGEWFTGEFQDNVAARVVETSAGRFGHMRLWSFDLRDDDGFIAEIVAMLDELPRNGLIIDLRGNPGGLIWAAERMLQLFTPTTIEPTRFSILATDLTRTMAAAPQGATQLAPWQRSLNAAVTNGEIYARELPLTPVSLCNDLGQYYPGPVVAIVDANTYSAGDLFAAGFVDNRVGTLVSVGDATGAGGANVWFPEHIRRALAGTGYDVPDLPQSISYTFSFRRAVRIGDAAGMSIEDLGVSGHERRSLTRRDLTDGNKDLLDYCGRLLASEIVTDMDYEITGDELVVRTKGLDRVDLLVNNHPLHSEAVDRAAGFQKLTRTLPENWRSIEIAGLVGDTVRQRRRIGP
jgi:hypothetical protein